MLKVLDLIQDIFPPAKDFKVLLEEDILSQEMINTLLSMLKEVSTEIANMQDKERLDKSIAFIHKITAQEQAEQSKDEQKLKELEAMFDQI